MQPTDWTSELIARYLRGEIRIEDLLDWARGRDRPELRPRAAGGSSRAQSPAASLDRAIERVYRSVLQARRHAPERAREVETKLEELMTTSPGERPLFLYDAPSSYCDRTLCETLLGRCREALERDPAEAEALVELARWVFSLLPDDEVNANGTLLKDLEAAIELLHGQARRLLEDLPNAEKHLGLAYRYLRQGTGDLLLCGELLTLHAGLLRSRQRLQEAAWHLRRAAMIYRTAGEDHLAGRCLLEQGLVWEEAGNLRRAEDRLAAAARLLDPARDPAAAGDAMLHLAQCRLRDGRPEEALAVLDRSGLGGEAGGLEARARWIEARCRAALGDDDAETRLADALEGLDEAGRGAELALAGLGLASLKDEKDDREAIRGLIEHTFGRLYALDVQRDVLSAWILLRQAAEASTVPASLLAATRQAVERAGSRPHRTPEAVC